MFQGSQEQRFKTKPKFDEDGEVWGRLTLIANDDFETFRLNFSRCTNRDVAPVS